VQLSNEQGDGNTYVYGSGGSPATLPGRWSFTTSPLVFEQYGTVGSPLAVVVNGVTQTVAGGNAISDNGSAGIYVGNYFAGNVGFQGDIAEILVYDHALIAADVTAVRGYLHGRYGVP
jgi:hypothetical protein